MPIYEFECAKCEVVKEEIFPINSCPTEIECGICGDPAKKIVSQSTFILVGSGWCRDGYTSAKDKGRNMGVAV